MTDLALGSLMGMRLIENSTLVIDSGKRSWARVRSHGRARRRLRQGHRQNIDVVWVPDPKVIVFGDQMVGHPATIQKLVAKIGSPS